MKTRTTLWDASEHLKTKEDMATYMACALEEGDSALIAAALGDIARAQGMTKIAKKTGLGRESLYKTLSRDGNPELTTVLKVFDAVGLRLKAEKEANHALLRTSLSRRRRGLTFAKGKDARWTRRRSE